MTAAAAGPGEVLALLGRQADHRDAEQAFLAAGWTACGAGDRESMRAGLAAADARAAGA
jgi:hypothetical protein